LRGSEWENKNEQSARRDLEETLFECQCKIEIVAVLGTKPIVRDGRTLHDEGGVRGVHCLRDKDLESAMSSLRIAK
jgi:hypothetical protein